MRCINCNTQLADDADFCTECGKKVEFNLPLIDRARRGVSQAQTTLYNATYNNVYVLVKSMIKDEDTVLDILQDSYVKAFRSLDQLQEPNKFRPWLKTIARNRTMDYFRERKQVMFSEMASVDDENAEIEFVDENPAVQPEMVADQKETARLVEEILDTLSDDQRAVVSMRYYEQMSVAEIASALGVSENTVKTRLHYGRKKIESQVLALEKKGTKIYGLAPIPFLLMLLHGQEAQAMSLSGETLLQSVLAECANLQESVAASRSVAETMKQSGRSAGTPGRRAALQAAGGTGKSAAVNFMTGLMQYTAAKIIIAAVALIALTGVIIGVVSSGRRGNTVQTVQQIPSGQDAAQAVASQSVSAQPENRSGEVRTSISGTAGTPELTSAQREEEGRRRAAEIWGDTDVTEYVLLGMHFYVPSEYAVHMPNQEDAARVFRGRDLYTNTYAYIETDQMAVFPEFPEYSGQYPLKIGFFLDQWNNPSNTLYEMESGSGGNQLSYRTYIASIKKHEYAFTIEVGATGYWQPQSAVRFGGTPDFDHDNLSQMITDFPYEKVLLSAWMGEVVR
ncbi:MAG: sigma-70 family RNA polymerase sigma factor [Lachnospiraceae bacterium]|nr:sigma-70 family RNA polymerase sigma factor [Lachnospiraceae bacterium]